MAADDDTQKGSMSPRRRIPDELARRRSVIVAGHQGDPQPALDHLDDPDPTVRSAALGALERTGSLEAEHLRAALADADAGVRRRALEAVAASDPGDDVAVVPLLDDLDPTVVEVAAWASGERSPAEPGAVERLIRLSGDADDALVREAAVAALGSLGDARGLPAVLQAMSDKATVRRRAVIALAAFEGPEVEAALERAVDDRDWQVRQAAEDLRQH